MVKRTLQEIANFFDMAVAVDEDGQTYMHEAVPYIHRYEWMNDGTVSETPYCLVAKYSGDWRESLTLPDSWPKEPPFKEGEVIWHKELNFPFIWRTEHGLDKNDYRRPTEAEWKVLKGEE